jgi:hypothetical protein
MVGRLDHLRAQLIRRVSFRPFFVVALAALAACEGGSGVSSARAEGAPNDSVARAARVESERARQDSIVRARPGYVIDSILPVDEEIRRFQSTAGDRPAELLDGARSREELVARFVATLERGDTAALRDLVVTKAEFAYLVYPTSPNTRPPYRQPPDLVWLTRSASTDKAVRRLADRFGNKPLPASGFECTAPAEKQGDNTLWSGCTLTLVGPDGATSRLRLFGAMIGRHGRYKFLSLTNGL